VNIQLDCVCVFFISIVEEESFFILIFEYSEKSQKIALYLFTLRKSFEMTLKKLNKFKKKVFRFKLQRDQFFRRNSKNVFMRRMIDDFDERQRILKQLHDENDHWNKENIYKKIIDRYWWNDLYDDAQKYVKICSQCQMLNSIKKEKGFHFISMTLLWEKIEMNIVYMSSNKEKHYLIVIRDDFFDWTKTRVLFKTRTWRMTKFFWKNVICRHDCFEKLIVNDEFKNKEILDKFVQRIGKSGSSRTSRGRRDRECSPVRADPRWSVSVFSWAVSFFEHKWQLVVSCCGRGDRQNLLYEIFQ
jgi:hypothetical protein